MKNKQELHSLKKYVVRVNSLIKQLVIRACEPIPIILTVLMLIFYGAADTSFGGLNQRCNRHGTCDYKYMSCVNIEDVKSTCTASYTRHYVCVMKEK